MTLSVVATPIGNLKDISLRAKEVLEQATLIVAEDTRTTGQLLKLLAISGKKDFVSSHAQSSDKELQSALLRCSKHEHIALVTDAGTPAISDPGSFFINEFRKKYPAATIIPVPGVSAVTAALSVSGFPASHFEFLGFLPHKKGRQTLIKKIAVTSHTLVFYESPHRILKALLELSQNIGTRKIFLAREITKLFEEYRSGQAQEIYDYFYAHPEKCRGEFVIIIAPTNYE